jgi:hypothetical protein
VPIATFADQRLAALLEQRREAELVQCALRGRPFDHPETQITLLFSLPLPDLPPTVIVEANQQATSNRNREQTLQARLCAATRQLLDQGVRAIDVKQLAAAAQASVVSVRRHWSYIARRLHLTMVTSRRAVRMPRGGVRFHRRMVLIRRGRRVPPPADSISEPASDEDRTTAVIKGKPAEGVPSMMNDQARRRFFPAA